MRGFVFINSTCAENQIEFMGHNHKADSLPVFLFPCIFRTSVFPVALAILRFPCYNVFINMEKCSFRIQNSKEVLMLQIPHIGTGDILELKKPHPCGEKRFRVMRTGSDIRLVCVGCGRDMVLPREKVEKAIRRITPAPEQ